MTLLAGHDLYQLGDLAERVTVTRIDLQSRTWPAEFVDAAREGATRNEPRGTDTFEVDHQSVS
jgi:hypothetical protein